MAPALVVPGSAPARCPVGGRSRPLGNDRYVRSGPVRSDQLGGLAAGLALMRTLRLTSWRRSMNFVRWGDRLHTGREKGRPLFKCLGAS